MKRRQLELAAAIAAIALALAPLIVALVTRTGHDWLPIHDVAVTDMRVRDVWTSDTPLVGPYSRYLWNHPGPILFWMLAIPSALSGQAAWGTLVGGVLVQAAAVVWAGVLSWRVGRLPTVLVTMSVLLLTYRALDALVILEPWNPHIALPWFVLFSLYAWRLALGELKRLPGAFFVASFLVQTHVGYLPLVAAAVVAVIGYRAVDHRHGDTVPVGRRPVILTAAIAVVLWIPVLIEQFVHEPGNLTRLYDYFIGGQNTEPSAGIRRALGLFGSAFGVPPPWLGGSETHLFGTNEVIPGRSIMIVIPLALLVLGFIGARRTGNREHRRLAVVAAMLFVAGVVALSRVTGELLEYLFYWRIPLALFVVVTGLVGAIDLVATYRPVWHRASAGRVAMAGIAAALTMLVVVSATTSTAVATHDAQIKEFEGGVQLLLDQIDVDSLRDQTVLVRFHGSTVGGAQGGVVDALDREGVAVRVDEELSFQFGDHRGADPADVDEVWYVLEDGVLTSLATTSGDGRVVVRVMPLGPDKEAEMVDLQLALLEQLRDAQRLDLRAALDTELVAFVFADVPGIDQQAAARLGELNAELRERQGCRCSIVAYAPDDLAAPAG
jgi:hypothetical protein